MKEIGHTHPLGNDWQQCTGCGACVAACSMNCIIMGTSCEGFHYPQIDINVCRECGQCHKTCPVINEPSRGSNNPNGPLQILAAWNLNDTVRHESSSGGVFSVLAENIIARGGVVVGAAFDEQLVVHHVGVETSTDLHRLRGSKYVQSQFSRDLYHVISYLLGQGRLVLFSGTPCQVAGLRNYLREPYHNLFCCDLICFGIPSPLLWERYLKYNRMKGQELSGCSFRDKTYGWKRSGVSHKLKNGNTKYHALLEDPYMKAFIRAYSLRSSCYACKFKSITRVSDLTLADFWGVEQKYPEYDIDDGGTSLILVNTPQGQSLLNECRVKLFIGDADIETAVDGNPMLVRSNQCPQEREAFYNDLEELSFPALIRKYRLLPPSLITRLSNLIIKQVIRH